MKVIVYSMLAIAYAAAAAEPSLGKTTCDNTLDLARHDLSAAGLRQIIAKPSLNYVGRNGAVYTDTQVSLMRRQLELAQDDCRRSDTAASAAKIQRMYAILKKSDE